MADSFDRATSWSGDQESSEFHPFGHARPANYCRYTSISRPHLGPYFTSFMQPIQFPAGSEPLVTVSKAHEHVWVIEMHNGVDNRLTQDMCLAFKPALDIVEKAWRDAWRVAYHDNNDKEKGKGSGALIIVANRKQQKFFSNGFDYPTLLKRPHFIPTLFHPILKQLLGFPIPVIAAINGHAFAAGFILALGCDYRVMKAQKSWLSMNELLFGGPIPHSFAALFNSKCADSTVVRKIFLEAHRFTAQEAIEARLVDEIADGDSDAVFDAALKRALKLSHLPRMGVYGLIKKEVNGMALQGMVDDPRMEHVIEEDQKFQIKVDAKL